MVFTMESRGKNAESKYDEWQIDEDEEMLADAEFYSNYDDDDRIRYLFAMEKYMRGSKNERRIPKLKCTPSQQADYKLKKEFKRQRAQQKKAEQSFLQNKRHERAMVVKEQHENQDDDDDFDGVLVREEYYERMEREEHEWDDYVNNYLSVCWTWI